MINTTLTNAQEDLILEEYRDLMQEEIEADYMQNSQDAQEERDLVNTDAQLGGEYWSKGL